MTGAVIRCRGQRPVECIGFEHRLQVGRAAITQFDQVLEGKEPLALKSGFEDKYHLLANLESGFVHTDFNMSDGRIGYHPDAGQNDRNKALRCAIIKAFDWPKRNEVFYYGIGQVFPGITFAQTQCTACD